MNSYKATTITILVALVLIGGGFWLWQTSTHITKEPIACALDAKLCTDGTYVTRIGDDCHFPACPKEDLIVVDIPRAYEAVRSPFIMSGKARGYWYFEASFPVTLYDENDTVIAQTYASAGSDWMTEDFVPFTANLNFTVTKQQTGKLVLQKDNPSDDPSKDDQIVIPVDLRP